VSATQSLMDDLETAVQTGSREKRVETLRRITDLFLAAPAQLSNEQIGVFDDVLTHLVTRVETKARAELARRLAPIEQAPGEVIRKLANDDEIAVAGPVLAASTKLTTQDLVGIARQKGQAHLLAIAGRAEIEEQVTDVLVDRGSRDVIHRLATNAGAAFSEAGYTTIVKRAEGDDSLLETLGRRVDMPVAVLRDLLRRATEAVRTRLLDTVAPDKQDVLRSVLAEISDDIAREAPAQRNVEDAQRLVLMMKETGRLNEGELAQFARQNKYDETVAALAAICAVPFELIDRLMANPRNDALLVPCKAAGLGWPTVRALLDLRSARQSMSEHDVADVAAEFKKLTTQTAARVLRFWQVRQTVAGEQTP
jgi:uncharacterized protein (DUF2336 family)